MKKLSPFEIILIIIIVIMMMKAFRDSRSTPATVVIPTPEENANSVSSAKAEGVVTQNDGSVIVRDKGASFIMAPVSKQQPKIVPEQEVRGRKPQQ